MTLEMPTKKWQITEESKKRVEAVREEIERDDKEFENSNPQCPIHLQPMNFVKYEGAYTRGYAIFRCPQGHNQKVG